MGHDHHFLERLDRIQREHLDYALALYRDHDAVRYLLEHLEVRGDERIALAIGTVERGPYVVVASNGAFVTCLGEGMSPGPLHVVERARVDQLVERFRGQRTREQIADDLLRDGEERADLFSRVLARDNQVCRDEFMALSGFAPMCQTALFATANHLAAKVAQAMQRYAKVTKIKPAEAYIAKELFSDYWYMAHTLLLSALGETWVLDETRERAIRGGFTMTTTVALYGRSTLQLRGAWAVGSWGRQVVPMYLDSLQRRHDWLSVLDALLALGTIAIRHPSLTDEIVAAIRSEDYDGNDPEKRKLTTSAVAVLFDTDGATAMALKWGRARYMEMSAHLPEGDPHRFADIASVPDDLAKTALLSADVDILSDDTTNYYLLLALPVVASAKPEEFYFERAVARKLCPEWTPDVTLRIVKGHVLTGSWGQDPVRAKPTPGRNEPCSCGSGKKYKKCCGAS